MVYELKLTRADIETSTFTITVAFGLRMDPHPPGKQVVHQPALDLAALFQTGLLILAGLHTNLEKDRRQPPAVGASTGLLTLVQAYQSSP